MSDETLTVTATIDATPETVFDVLADPTTHEAIDGTGWVQGADDSEPLRSVGQLFGMAMYHADHPDGRYGILNRVEVCDRPRAIAWRPGQDLDGSGEHPQPCGWTWRYDLAPAGPSSTTVSLTYDWSGASAYEREVLAFPPFPVSHLENSLAHLAGLATQGNAPARGSSAGTR